MTEQEQLTETTYNPNHLLDALIERMELKNDGELARSLKVTTTIIRNIRQRRLPVGASILLWMHEATGIRVDELRELMGDRRIKCRPIYSIPREPLPPQKS